MIISPIQWSIDDQIAQATRSKPALPGGPEGLLYIPSALRQPLMDSFLSRLWTTLLVALYDPGHLLIRQGLLSLCHSPTESWFHSLFLIDCGLICA